MRRLDLPRNHVLPLRCGARYGRPDTPDNRPEAARSGTRPVPSASCLAQVPGLHRLLLAEQLKNETVAVYDRRVGLLCSGYARLEQSPVGLASQFSIRNKLRAYQLPFQAMELAPSVDYVEQRLSEALVAQCVVNQ